MSPLKVIRENARMKQISVCRLLSLDPGQYSRIESGDLQPGPERMAQIRGLLERLAKLRQEYWFADLNDPRVARSLLDIGADRAT